VFVELHRRQLCIDPAVRGIECEGEFMKTTQRHYIKEILDGVEFDIVSERPHIIFAKSRTNEQCVEVKFEGDTIVAVECYEDEEDEL
jgi:hypothetical protein